LWGRRRPLAEYLVGLSQPAQQGENLLQLGNQSRDAARYPLRVTAGLLEMHGVLNPSTLDRQRCLEVLEVARQSSQHASQVDVRGHLAAAGRRWPRRG